MKRATFNILFYIKRTKILKNGNSPIYLRITFNGESVETSLKRSINPLSWDTNRNKSKGKNESDRELNEYLNSIRAQLFLEQRNFQEMGKKPTAKLLLNTLIGKGEKQWSLVELFIDHNSKLKKLIQKEFSPLTLQRYDSALKHLKNYCIKQYKNEFLPIAEVDYKFITGFEYYLKTEALCQHNSSMKHIKALKKIIRIALANDYIRKDPFINYKITYKNVEREYLTDDELKLIINKDIGNKRLDLIRDLFVFECYTGIAYKDLATLKKDNIIKDSDGNLWIQLKRGKTGVACRIPIFPLTEDIINKYKLHPEIVVSEKLLPVPTNQKMNAYLKEIASICGINKDLHTHLARHTYATTITLSNGIPIETISKLLGHRKMQTTQIYARVIDKKVEKDIDLLRQKLI
jgi:site-specific recombinase XerD